MQDAPRRRQHGIDIPASLRQITIDREGDAGREWLRSLPSVIDDLLQQWNCVPSAPAVSGKVGVIVPARSASHGDVVLKVSFPHAENVHEPDAYATWDGRGSVRLRERDDARFGMLLERIEPIRPVDDAIAEDRFTGNAHVVDEAIGIAGTLSRVLAVPAPDHLPRMSERAPEWSATIDRAVARMPRKVVVAAQESARELCFVQPGTMQHGDLHFNNILRGRREPWQVIDPKGCVGDPAADAFILIRTTATHLRGDEDLNTALNRWIAIFAESAGIARDHVRRWVQMRAVETAQRHAENEKWPTVRALTDRIAEELT